MASAWQSKKGGRLAIHRPEGWRGTGGFWHSDLLGKVTGTLPGRPCVISDRHPGETAPSQPVFLTSSKKPLHINAVQFSFLPSRFIFPSYQKCHGNCSPGSNSPGRNRQVLPVFDPVGFCSFLRHIPKILGNLRERVAGDYFGHQRTTNKERTPAFQVSLLILGRAHVPNLWPFWK